MSSPHQDAPQGKPAIGAELIIPLIGCALTLYYLVSTLDLVWEARATGTVIGLVLLALCGAFFVKFGLRIASGRGTLALGELINNDEFNRQRLGLIVAVALYVVTLPWVGATIGLFFLLVGCMWMLGVRKPSQLLGIALGAALFVHLTLITLLDSKLPRGVIIDQFAPTPISTMKSKPK
jgi:hypothetical protein